VVSVLARLDIDPWEEAAQLSGLRGEVAADRLASFARPLSRGDRAKSRPLSDRPATGRPPAQVDRRHQDMPCLGRRTDSIPGFLSAWRLASRCSSFRRSAGRRTQASQLGREASDGRIGSATVARRSTVSQVVSELPRSVGACTFRRATRSCSGRHARRSVRRRRSLKPQSPACASAL
jgi:hypothetical protein